MTDIDLSALARTAVLDAIGDLAHDRMGLAEILDNQGALDELDADAQNELCERLAGRIREYQYMIVNGFATGPRLADRTI